MTVQVSASGSIDAPHRVFGEQLRWLLDVAPQTERLDVFVDELVTGLRSCGIPLDRVALRLGRLHRRLPSLDVVWTGAGAAGNHVTVRPAPAAAPRHDDAVRAVRARAGTGGGAPHLFESLRMSEGLADCLVVPLDIAGPEPSAALWATQERRGFDAVAMRRLERVGPFLSRALEGIALRQLAAPSPSPFADFGAGAEPVPVQERARLPAAASASDGLISPAPILSGLELSVIGLARREAAASTAKRFALTRWLTSSPGPLANPGLEALRVYVDALVCGRRLTLARGALLAAGYTADQRRAIEEMVGFRGS